MDLSLADFLEMLPPLKPRQYSIASSPVEQKDRIALTISVLNAPAWSEQGQYLGVASNYLAYQEPGTQIYVVAQPSNNQFQLPENPEIPVIMVGAGSGIAPFRGFIQERAVLKAQGEKVGEMALFFGCDHPEVDLLYHEELNDWKNEGVVDVYPAFAMAPENDIKYVQDRIWAEREKIVELFQQNARIFVCGDGKYMAPAVRETFIKIYQEESGVSAEEAMTWAGEIEKQGVRYVTDVFA